ncbi:chaperone modulator CbpM [Mucilaginibacter sp. BT774]|uniref:chaperone modulator CbpM n=1 Tax=Mucilaginibacter sp. BT774 TaxID=3062276 RepID=UPI002675A5F1|nr:chaperone modulator CbpM [Mucilaginibacter sp. BT774]MDO3627941.1 chaperone modulator CbpM [Mucilaginibacter sp. BT774]
MSTATLISTTEFCTWHQVEHTFIHSLSEAGLIEITLIDQDEFIHETQLQRLEKMVRLHHELEINLAGIEAITHLLDRVEAMHQEMRLLKNRLRLYERD